jgi:hypothetical protein
MVLSNSFAATVRILSLSCLARSKSSLVSLVADEGDDHAVEVEEEHDQVEAELDEWFLCFLLAPFLCGNRVEKVLVLHDPNIDISFSYIWRGALEGGTYFFAFHPSKGKFKISASQYPLTKNKSVRKAWTAASGMM